MKALLAKVQNTMKTKVLVSIIAAVAGLFAIGVVVAAVSSSIATKEPPQQIAAKMAETEESFGTDDMFPPVDDVGPAYAAGPGFDSPAAFGDAVTFPNGLKVTISDVEFHPANSDYPGNYDLTYKVSVENGTGQRLDGVMTTAETPAEEFMGPSYDTEEMPTLFAGDEGSEVQGVMVEQDISGERLLVHVSDPDFGASAVWEGVIP